MKEADRRTRSPGKFTYAAVKLLGAVTSTTVGGASIWIAEDAEELTPLDERATYKLLPLLAVLDLDGGGKTGDGDETPAALDGLPAYRSVEPPDS